MILTKKKIQREREQLIKDFETTYIFDENKNYQRNIKVKNYVDGSKYEGEVLNDKRNGKGIYHYANQDKYIGDWKKDKFHGDGIYIFKNGERY